MKLILAPKTKFHEIQNYKLLAMKTAGDEKKDSMTFITIKSHAENLEGSMGKINLPIPEGTKRIFNKPSERY